MQQLWLNGKRIDCIDQLREVLKEGDEDDQALLCLKLLELLNKGALQAWLARQAHHKMLLDSTVPPDALKEAVKLLQAVPADQEMTGEGCEALAVLCSLSADHFTGKEKKQAKKAKAEAYKKRWLKEKGYWDEELFRAVADWDWVITTREELRAAIEKLQGRKENSAIVELFLCKTDKDYEINLRNVKNVTIVGVGNPRARHVNSLEKSDWIHAHQDRLTFKNFTLLCPRRDKIVVDHDDEKNKFLQRKC